MATINNVNLSTTTVGRRSQIKAGRESRLATFVRTIEPSWWPYLLVGVDALLILLAFATAYYVRYELQLGRLVDPANRVGILAYVPFAALLVVVCLLS